MRRLLTPFGGVCVFLVVALLVLGGLAWVTIVALRVEAAEREANSRAEFAAKERLALWQLDSRLFPSLTVENSRPYAQYFSLYVPHAVAFDAQGNVDLPGRVPSPLLSADLPKWMLLHFQLDPETGWQSPQVPIEQLVQKLPPQDRLALQNLTPIRQSLLSELREKFEASIVHSIWLAEAATDPSDGAIGVPLAADGRPALPGLFGQRSAHAFMGGNRTEPDRGLSQMMQPPAEYQQAANRFQNQTQNGNDLYDLRGRQNVLKQSARDLQNLTDVASKPNGSSLPNEPKSEASRTPPLPTLTEPAPSPVPPSTPPPAAAPRPVRSASGGGTPTSSSPAPPAAPSQSPAMDAAPQTIAVPQAPPQPAPSVGYGYGTSKPLMKRGAGGANAPTVSVVQPPAVHVGPMRPQWLIAEDGSLYLVLVRIARLEAKTVFQGVVLDWPKLRTELLDGIRPNLPEAQLQPVFAGQELTERQMAAIPATLQPGPLPDPPPTGRTPLRLGLALAWLAAIVALTGTWFAGWTLIDLSERRIRFVSAVTHELRTPLTSMRLYLDLLTSGMIADEAKQREYLQTLHGESDRLNQLIENVLDFARLEKRSARAIIASTRVDELLNHARQTWFDRCAAEGKELVVISTLPVDTVVQTDARIAEQIVSNLIDNARKYSAGATDPRIWLWAKPGEGKRIVLEVEDRGPGVAAADRATIFKPFRRGQGADTTAGGAGLGLALAKQWAEMLGATLTYRPADGASGAIFRLEL